MSATPEQWQLVQAFVNKFNSYWRTGNESKVATLYDEFTSFVNVADNSVLYGRESKA